MRNEKLKVVYIAGFPRSGSTLLTRILGSIDGWLSVGEAIEYPFNLRMFAHNWPCGCGQQIAACYFWGSIIENLNMGARQFFTRFMRFRYLPLLISPLRPPTFQERETEFLQEVESLFRCLAQRSKACVIVEDSKNPIYAYVLRKLPFEMYFVHLVRDVRGVVGSAAKPKGYLWGGTASVFSTVLWWSILNTLAELLRFRCTKHYLQIRYEDVMTDPRGAVEKIVCFVTGKTPELNFFRDREVQLSPQHLLGGNPDKLSYGTVAIQPRHWKLPVRQRLMVSTLAAPLLLWYHYFSLQRGRRECV